MQPRPALPWSADTERGTIRLNKYVSQQDLLDGILKWTVSDYHGTDMPGVIDRTSGNKLVLQDGNGQMMYEIADFSQSTNVLELTRMQGSSESLLSVEFPPAVQFNPALPWNSETVGASITLNTPLSDEELANGMLRIIMQSIEVGALALCYVDSNANKILTATGVAMAVITTERNQNNKVKKININSIDSGFQIVEISQGSEYPEFFTSSPLPLSGTISVSCSRPITFNEVLAHVKVKLNGSEEWLSANQRDQFACDWLIDQNRKYTYTASNNDGQRSLILMSGSGLSQLVAIKYEP